ncbi:hypothetical protein OSH11_13695 [Kaistia dalseonensis]|uniref:Transposase n=1 Tax=Kaistia dalseonensis TaxID=410840 RepID=A0ABU0H7T0_9HYPH|nr:hypothetical protein [Kaistia dalseonensis]MCX5495762.1 hypothetical protein [Kaistia dalseonensis]MDQ0438362.1 hypothetical protein [Kaistia dalseonensis]
MRGSPISASSSGRPWREARDAEIVEHALAGRPPVVIAETMRISIETIYGVLRKARSSGIAVPAFARRPPGDEPRRFGPVRRMQATLHDRGAERPWAEGDDAQLASLLRRGVRLTSVAAMMRQPYGVIFAAAGRLGLLRVQS